MLESDLTGFEVAVIGMSCRFPGAPDLRAYWRNLSSGHEAIKAISKEELLEEGEEESAIDDPFYIRSNAYLENKERFDASFFNYTPDEGKLMDPQMRILHECVWQAIEDAGYNCLDYDDKIGLFTGATTNLNWLNYAKIENLKKLTDNFSLAHLSDANFSNTRISYQLNLKGPSLSLNSACSTSLAAIHQAYNSVLLGECAMAVAGGITINNFSKKGYMHRDGMILSANGQCRTFDDQASGTVGGEGVGLVVLKRLKKALQDKDHIYAVIKGSGINNDGRNKVGYTAPGVDGQTEAIMMARKMAKVPAESITYVEAHGTATRLGDPIEVEALTRAFGKNSVKYCALGSVKSNIGHLDSAAGVAGFIKVVLALANRQIPPSLHFESPNKRIDFDSSPFYVNTKLREWKNDKYPLRAGVSSFGIGGTNVHLILEEAPLAKTAATDRQSQLLVVSGKTKPALEANAFQLADHLSVISPAELADIAFTLQTGRKAFEYRKIVVCDNKDEAIEELRSGRNDKFLGHPAKPQVVFMFPGQGSQYVTMCAQLYVQENHFKLEVDKCLEIAKRFSDTDFGSLIFPTQERENSANINQTEFTQPVLFIIEYALARLLMSWGINPDFMIGHSIGEYVAACLSGVFSLEDAISVVLQRGKLMQTTRPGKMLSVVASSVEMTVLLSNYKTLSIAAINSPQQCVVSGEESAIIDLQASLEIKGYQSKIIRTSHAFHSGMMDGILPQFCQHFTGVKFNSPQIPFISNLTGKVASYADISGAQYWADHLRGTIQFSAGLQTLLDNKDTVFIEVGPGQTLCSFVEACKRSDQPNPCVSTVKRAGQSENDQKYLLGALGKMWLNGIQPDWAQLYKNEVRKRKPLPAYAFDKTEFPVHVDSFRMISEMIGKPTASKAKDISDWFYLPTWKLAPRIFVKDGLKKRPTLLLADFDVLVGPLLKQFQLTDQPVVLVEIGGSFLKKSTHNYEVNPAQASDFLALFEDLSRGGLLPERIIHGWSVHKEQVTHETFNHRCDRFYHSLIHCLKAANKFGGLLEKQIVTVSSDLHHITEDSALDPVKSLVLGLLKVLPQEFPTVEAKHIDFALKDLDHALIEQLWREISYENVARVVSFRGGKRWEQSYDSVRISKSDQINFVDGGVYVITGGLGQLGYSLATQILTKYRVRAVVLLGRTELSSQRSADDERNAKLINLRKLGNIEYISCNIGIAEELSHAVNVVEKNYGRISGVIHTAGVLPKGSLTALTELTEAQYDLQFGPKVLGMNSLKTVFATRGLDFCLATSSLSVVLGGLGLSAYASANTFMSYEIMSGQNAIQNWISLELDGLNFDSSNSNAIHPEQVFEVIEHALSWKQLPRLIVSPTNLTGRLRAWVDGQLSEKIKDRAETISDPAPQAYSTIEDHLLHIWQKFFGRPDITVSDSFFDIGGDSLKALVMIGRIHQALNVQVAVKDFFDNSSIQKLGGHINRSLETSGQGATRYSPIEKIEKKEFYACSSAQERMMYEQFANEKSLTNNISKAFLLTKTINPEKLRDTFQALVNRHECLRTSIVFEDGNIAQRIQENVDFHLVPIVNSKYKTASEAFNDFVRPFDLSVCPTLRCGLYNGREGNFLFIDTHHAVCDGVSMDILMNEFIKMYSGEELNPLSVRYVDYAHWQKKHIEGLSSQKEYWAQQLSGELLPINLPLLRDRENATTQAARKEVFKLTDATVARIKGAASQGGVSDFMFMLSAYYVLLTKVSGDRDLIVGTDAVGRTQAELTNIVGTFINALPLRVRIAEDATFKTLLQSVRTVVLDSLKNQDFQYELMPALVSGSKRRSLIDVYFSYINFFGNGPMLMELGFQPLNFDKPEVTTRYEIELNVTEQYGEFILTFLYSTELYDESTIKLLADYYQRILSVVLDNPAVPLQAIEMEQAVPAV